MWVKSLHLKSVRSFENFKFDFSQSINILVGPNNAGKSTVLRPILGLQQDLPTLTEKDVRANCANSRAELVLADDHLAFLGDFDSFWYEYPSKLGTFPLLGQSSGHSSETKVLSRISPSEPNNFIVPFLSGRWGAPRSFSADEKSASAVHAALSNMDAKVDKVNSSSLHRKFYEDVCVKTLRLLLTTAHTKGGRHTVYTINEKHDVALDQMGSGSRSIAGLVALMAGAKGKLLIVEEPENDLHPEALKALLPFIVEVSKSNQFIITTHSHIVLNVLGAESDTKIWYVDIDYPDRVPTSSVKEIEDADERLEVLHKLGYESSDMSAWDGWLLLEESSAEKIIRDFLMPWFTPYLRGRLGTCSSGSLSQVKGRFEALNSLFLFVHLTQPYQNRAWVVVDDGEAEKEIIHDLQERYEPSGWKKEQFRQWSKHDFEDYYPDCFDEERRRALGIAVRKERMEAKTALLKNVLGWIGEDEERAKKKFAKSAAEVIDVLKEINNTLSSNGGEDTSS